jgi:hypothetical protein
MNRLENDMKDPVFDGPVPIRLEVDAHFGASGRRKAYANGNKAVTGTF